MYTERASGRTFLLLCTITTVTCLRVIKVGGIFDRNDKEAKDTFQFAINQFNTEHADDYWNAIRLKDETKDIDIDNSARFAMEFCRMAESGVVAIFGSMHPLTQSTMESYSKTLGIPYITHSHTDITMSRNSGFQIYLCPVYEAAIVDVMRNLRWKHAYYLYNSFAGLHRAQQLYNVQQQRDSPASKFINIQLLKVENTDDALQKLLNVYQNNTKQPNRLVVDLSYPEVENLIYKLNNQTHTIRSKFHIFAAGIGFNEMNMISFTNKQAKLNLTGLRLVNEFAPNVKDFFREWKSKFNRDKMAYTSALVKDAVAVFGKAVLSVSKNTRNAFLTNLTRHKGSCNGNTTAWPMGYTIMRLIKQTTLIQEIGISGFVKFDQDGYRTEFSLDVIGKPPANASLLTLARWKCNNTDDSDDGTRRPRADTCYDDNIHVTTYRQGEQNVVFDQKTLIVTSHIGKPYMFIKNKSEDGRTLVGNDRYQGYCADLTRELFLNIKFSYIIKPVADGGYGSPDANGTWNGMVGEIQRGEADLAIADLSITAQREEAVYFSKPFMSLGISIMIKKPKEETPNQFSFLTPLAFEVWMCIIFAYLGVSVVLFLVSRFSPDEWSLEESDDCAEVKNIMSIWNCLWFSLGAFMQQGCEICPKSTPGRIVSCVWWLFTLILISSYTANLAAFLTVSRMKSPIQSAADLASQTVIKYGCILTGTTKDFFKDSKVATYERMWAFMSTNPDVLMKSNDEGIERVRTSNNKFAWLIDSTTNEYVNKRQPCNTMKVGSNLNSNAFGVAMALDSQYKDKVTLAVLELREEGKLGHIQDKWWIKEGDVCPDEEKETNSLALGVPKIAGIFYILISGLGISLFMALLEVVFYNKLHAKEKKAANGSNQNMDMVDGPKTIDMNSAMIKRKVPSTASIPYSYAVPTGQLIGFEPYASGEPNQTQV